MFTKQLYFPVKCKRIRESMDWTLLANSAEEVTGAEMECFECHKEVKGH